MKQPLIATLAALSLALAVPAIAQQSVPVTFAKGKSSALISGSIKGDQDRNYIVDARAGQTMTVSLKSIKGSAEMNVWAPGKDTALTVGSIDPYKFTTVLPTTGRYRIQVYQMRAAARRGEIANYNLSVAVTGGAVKPFTDAKVPGTGYNATATVRCGRNADELTGRCDAGVKRNGNGTASVSLRTPQDGRRTIQFRGTTVVSTDGGVPFQVRRFGDINVISVGQYEVYEIPDALIVGG